MAPAQRETATTIENGELGSTVAAGRYDIRSARLALAILVRKMWSSSLVRQQTQFHHDSWAPDSNVTVTAGETELVSREKTDISMTSRRHDRENLPL